MIFEKGRFKPKEIRKSFVNESLKQTRLYSANIKLSKVPTVFLSHKHDDLEYNEDVQGIIEMLEGLGVKVYIDSIDNKMPNETSGETAKRLKEVIKACDKFVLLATDAAVESYWCNWELGFGDSHKFIENIAILPMKAKGSSDNEFKGNEYLQIYPRIDYEFGFAKYKTSKQTILKGYYYCKPKNSEGVRIITSLKDWLFK